MSDKYFNTMQQAASLGYNGDPEIQKANKLGSVLPMKVILVNSYDQDSDPYYVNIRLECTLDPDLLNFAEQEVKKLSYELSLEEKKSNFTEVNVSKIYDTVVKSVKYDDDMKRNCGDLSIDLVSDHHFLEYDKDTLMLKMIGSVTDLARVYKDSKLVATLMNKAMPVDIEAEFTPCALTGLGFEVATLHV